MNTLELKRVKAIFSVAVEQTGADREAFIEQACGDDLKLRAEVNAYLIAAEEAGDGLNSPTRSPPPAATLPDSRSRRVLGSVIGNYKLIEVIGEGGFGSVYMAEQQRPVLRQVALKIIKLGMDTQRVIDRFEAERQSLAIMDHPNIARVFDAGATEQGRPYFVMELVHGVPITDHCDAERLNTNRRLELFIIVCNAIQHAHAKGVIHRDIKPSNVLVTLHDGAAIPKVIDFGIAKAIEASETERTAFTDESQFIGTPAYMSPEQADTSGLDVDTRSDIYSLGVLLYELLTGTTPFDRKRLLSAPHEEVQRILRDIDPPKPSTRLSGLGAPLEQVAANRSANPLKLRQLIRGELDWIVMKAIAKDRARRYETAHELARDIRRYLNHEPVEACPPSAGYRFRTFVRRHHKAVSTTVGFVVTVAISIGMYIHGIRGEQRNTDAALLESQHQRDEADRRGNEAQQATVRALAAETQANHELVTAALTQAHGAQASARSGRRFNSLKTLAAAAKIKVNAEMRSQAITCLGVPDMRIARQWTGRDRAVCFDHSCTLYADCTSDGRILIRRIPDAANPQGATVVQLPGRVRIDPALLSFGGARVAFSPDDRQVAAGFDDGHIRVFTLEGVLVFDAASGLGFDFSPDGASIAMSEPDQPTAIFDLKTGKKLCQLAWASFDSLSFSPNGRKLAMWNAGRGEDVFIGEIETGGIMQLAHHSIVWGVAWHPSSILFAAAGNDRGIRLWNVAKDDPKILTFMDGHAAPVSSVRFTHSGDLLVSASEDGSIGLWDPYLKAQLMRVFCTGTLHLSNDDRLLGVVAPDGGHTLIEVADGLELRSLYAPSANRERVVFSQDGSLMACEGGRLLRFWNLTAPGLNEAHADLKFANTVRSVAFHPDGASLIVNTDGALSRISIREQPPQLNSPGNIPARQIQIGDRGEHLLSRSPRDDGASDMSPDGSHLALAPLGQDAVVLDLRSPSQPLTLPASADTSYIAISPDAKWVATGTGKGVGNHLRIWDATNGNVICSLPLSGDANVAFSPDNHWLATVTADELRFWQVGSWQPRQRCAMKSSLSGHIFFTADSRIVAIASHQMGVALVDVAAASELATLQDEWDERPMGFSPDGSLLVTKGPHTTLRLWDLRRIRAELGPMGLDWYEPPLPPRNIRKRIILTTTRPSPTTLPD